MTRIETELRLLVERSGVAPDVAAHLADYLAGRRMSLVVGRNAPLAHMESALAAIEAELGTGPSATQRGSKA